MLLSFKVGNLTNYSWQYILPVKGLSPLSLRTIMDGKPVTYVIPASRKVECGATTRMGASFLDACRPFTMSFMPPTWYVLLPSAQIIGFNFLDDRTTRLYVSKINPNLTVTFPSIACYT